MTITVSTQKAIQRKNLVKNLEISGSLAALSFSTPIVTIFNTPKDIEQTQEMFFSSLDGVHYATQSFLKSNFSVFYRKVHPFLSEKYVGNARNISKENLETAVKLIEIQFVLDNFNVGSAEESLLECFNCLKQQVVVIAPVAAKYFKEVQSLKTKELFSYDRRSISIAI